MVIFRRKSRSATLQAEPENQQQENPAGTPGTPARTNADPPVREKCARRHTVKQLARKDWNRHVRLQPEWQINQILYQPMPIQPHCKVGHIDPYHCFAAPRRRHTAFPEAPAPPANHSRRRLQWGFHGLAKRGSGCSADLTEHGKCPEHPVGEGRHVAGDHRQAHDDHDHAGANFKRSA